MIFSMPHAFLAGLLPTLHISHRGGAALAPENTLAAFEQAVSRYATQMLELDVHLTRDGELVVSHDPTVERCTDGAGAIAAMNVSELRKLDAGCRFSPDAGRTFPFRGRGIRIPTLVDVLRAFPSMRMNIDLKASTRGIEAVFAGVVRREGAAERICCGSELDESAARLATALPDCCLFYPRDALAAFVISVKSGQAPSLDERYTVLDMPLSFGEVRLVDEELVRVANETGRWINVWTIDDPVEMKTLIAQRVGGIMTDRPDLLRAALDSVQNPAVTQ